MALGSLFKKIRSPKKKVTENKRESKKVSSVDKASQVKTKDVPVVSPQQGIVELILLHTEKALDTQRHSQVVFRVQPRATKGQIATAIRETYQVIPLRVRTLRVRPKVRRRGRKVGWTNEWKKAYVTVPDLAKFTQTS